jgi:hypothetical protein
VCIGEDSDQDLNNRLVLGSAIENGIWRPPSSVESGKSTGRGDGIRHLKSEPTAAFAL